MANSENLDLKRLDGPKTTKFDYDLYVENNFEKVDAAMGAPPSTLTTEAKTLVPAINELDSNKVDKVEGKGLSTNDFDNEYKAKIDVDIPAQLDDMAINVKKFGAIGDGVIDDRIAIQNTFDNIADGSTLLIPIGTFRVDNSSPLTLTKNNITIIWLGTIKATQKKDLIVVTGNNFKVLAMNGILQGKGGTDAEGFCQNKNDPSQMVALIRVQGERGSIDGLHCIDAPAYGIRVENNHWDINNCKMEGGPVVYVGPNVDPVSADYNMAIDVKANCHDVTIRNCDFIANDKGGKASSWIFTGGTWNIKIMNNSFTAGHEHAIYNVAYDSVISSNYINAIGCEMAVIQHSGANSIISQNYIINAKFGGISLFNSKGCKCFKNHIVGFESAGIAVAVYNTYADSFKDIEISDNHLIGGDTPTKYIEGILINSSANSSKNIKIKGNTILKCAKVGNTAVRGSIRILGKSTTESTDYEISGNYIEDGGLCGVYAQNISDSKFYENTIIDVAKEQTLGGFQFVGVTNSKIYKNKIKDTRSTALMDRIALESAGPAKNEYYDNQGINLTNVTLFFLQDGSFASGGNKRKVGSLKGTFTMVNNAAMVINETISPNVANVMTTSIIRLYPKNADASKIQGSQKCLYVSITGTGSFTVATGDGLVPGVATAEYYWEAIQ